MLATPNNGSSASYRSRNFPISGTLAEVIEGKDRKSPAHIDITPSSYNLINLKC